MRLVSKEPGWCPRYWVNNLRLEFLHIPKTGGTSLRKTLKQVNRDIIHYAQLRKLHGYIPDNSLNPRENHEHSDYIGSPISGFNHGHRLVYPTPRRFFTFLRDPIDLSLSYIKMAQTSVINPYHGLANSNLGEMIDTCCEIKNSMTWRLAGLDQKTLNKYRKITSSDTFEDITQDLVDQCEETANLLLASQDMTWGAIEEQLNNDSYGHTSGSDKIMMLDFCAAARKSPIGYINHHRIIHNGEAYINNVTESTYELALANLKNFYFVGLFENYQKDVQILVNKIYKSHNLEKYTRKVKIPHLNRTRWRATDTLPLTQELKEKLIANNKYDIMLYEHIKEKN